MPEIKQLFSSPRCQHVHYSGRPCKAPARRGRNYCVFHQAAHLDPSGCVLPIVEDLHSYQVAVIRIMQSLAADAIDSRKATALLYALQLLGGKLDAFAKQRAEVENPALAMKKEISARYEARRNPFPLHVPERDVLAILKEMRAEQPTELNDDVEIFPQRVDQQSDSSAVIPSEDERERSERPSQSRNLHCSPPVPKIEYAPEELVGSHAARSESPMHFGPAQCIDPSSDSRPPQDDTGGGSVAGAA